MKPATRALLLWLGLIGVFVAIWQFLSPDRPQNPTQAVASAPSEGLGAWSTIAPVALFAIVIIVGLKRFVAYQARTTQQRHAFEECLRAGDLDGADRALDAIPTRLTVYRRLVASCRSTVSFLRGDLLKASQQIEAAIGGRRGLYPYTSRQNELSATAIRSVIRALSGDKDGARTDIETVRAASPDDAQAVAHVALSEALVAASAGDGARLRAVLFERRVAFRDLPTNQEKALVRALQATLEGAAHSVYRRPSDNTSPADSADRPLSAWAAKVAPSLAPFVSELHRASEPIALGAPPGAALSTVQRARVVPPGQGAKKRLAVWVVLIVAFLGVWQFASLSSPFASALAMSLPVLVVVALLGWLGFTMRRANREHENLRRSAALLGADDFDGARRLLESLGKSTAVRTAVVARLLLARIARDESRFEDALVEVDAALGRLARAEVDATPNESRAAGPVTIAVYAQMHNSIIAQRAPLLALLGRQEEALAEASLLVPMTPSVALRVQLFDLVRRGEVDLAATLVKEHLDIELDLNTEALTRLLVAGTEGDDKAIERARATIAQDRRLEGWIHRVAPALLATVAR